MDISYMVKMPLIFIIMAINLIFSYSFANANSGYIGLGLGWAKYNYKLAILEHSTTIGSFVLGPSAHNKLGNRSQVANINFFMGQPIYHVANYGFDLELGGFFPTKKSATNVIPVGVDTYHVNIKRNSEVYVGLRSVFDINPDINAHFIFGLVQSLVDINYSSADNLSNLGFTITGASGVGRRLYGLLLGIGMIKHCYDDISLRFDYIYTKYNTKNVNLVDSALYNGNSLFGYIKADLHSSAHHHLNLNLVKSFN